VRLVAGAMPTGRRRLVVNNLSLGIIPEAFFHRDVGCIVIDYYGAPDAMTTAVRETANFLAGYLHRKSIF
jgi:hypothetical protein